MGVILINDLIKSTNLVSVPSEYAFPAKHEDPSMLTEKEEQQVIVPVIDLSFLTSGSPDQQSKVIEDLRNVVNHGVPGSLEKEMMNSCKDFFNLSPKEKSACRGKHEIDPRILNHGTDYMLDRNILMDRWVGYKLDNNDRGTDYILDREANFNTAVESVSFMRDKFKVFVHPIFESPPKPEGLR
ncbi:probable 2-oxoglutarate-dependent dioxygenase At3g111800 [Papaver somniferum]|uniref:probable 2-oxoglutarate-dependent dioxygenase At3g111800 n=1 Tax=Papaver somniferum TaxID=3469 RepID=UPI000E6FC584|nr:probable 2-oxoglutarate-dependent dioxygenase At3g111800 [Papaver somniferum]